jgi:nitronate monooxygenase
MGNSKIKKLNIGDMIADIPIIQGGMAVGISMSGLASAVSNQGGIGVIASAGAGMLEDDFFTENIKANIRGLKKEIRKARELSKGLLGVNILVALGHYSEIVETAIAENVDIIFAGAGLPLDMPKYLSSISTTKLAPIVSSARAAKIICMKWIKRYNYLPDAIVVEGPLAGGHLGFSIEQIYSPQHTLKKIVSCVLKEIEPFEIRFGKKIPIIAAGGIYTGKDIYDFLKLGASGVQMATRFVTTHECDASDNFKQAYINANEEDIVIIESPIGMLGRAIKNKFIDDIHRGKKKPFTCPYHCIKTCDYKKSPYCIFFSLLSAQKGDFNNGFAFAGSNAWRATEIISVEKLIGTLLEEYEICYATSEISAQSNSLAILD